MNTNETQTQTPDAPITSKPIAKKTSKPKPIAKPIDYASLTNGGAHPVIFGSKIPTDIQSRHAFLFTFLNTTGLINAREISFFIGIRPDDKKSARVADFFKFTGKNVATKFPADKFKSEKLSVADAVKKYPALSPITKLTDVIIYLTASYGTKQLTLNFSFKY
jgi:hypothetical protein